MHEQKRMENRMSGLTPQQIGVLLRPLNPIRVANRSVSGTQLSYLEVWDVKAHMIRIFGFGGWSWEVLEVVHAFTEPAEIGAQKKPGFHVGYRVTGRLTVHSIDGQTVSGAIIDRDAIYTEAAVGFATLPNLGEAHDMACKTAESDAFKRAAICLGDQFGLGLYNKKGGAVVKATLAGPTVADSGGQSFVEDAAVEVEGSPDEAPAEPVADDTAETPAEPEGTPEPPAEAAPVDVSGYVNDLRALSGNGDIAAIVTLKAKIAAEGVGNVMHEGKSLDKIVDLAVVHAGKVNAKAGLGATEIEVPS